MKKQIFITLLTALFFTQTVFAEAETKVLTQNKITTKGAPSKAQYDPMFVPMDIMIFRPLGLVTTAIGSALFVVFSPFTALSTIAPPHDAFQRVGDAFVVLPATYTFMRPIGDKRFIRNYE